MVASVATTLTWPLLVLSFLAGLVALVRMADPAGSGVADATGIPRLPEALTATILTLFGLAALVFFVDIARRLRLQRRGEGEDARDPEPARMPRWLRTVHQIGSLLNVLLIAYLLWRGALPLAELLALGQGAGSGSVPAMPENPLGVPPFLTWTFGGLALAAGLAALALALWIAFSERLAGWWERDAPEPPPPPLAEAVEASLEDLRAEPDARRAIIRCYGRFVRAAADSGIERKPWHTPMEFMREALPRLPVPRGTVPTLTGLFELARFSHRALGPGERARALDALDEIKTALDARRADAAPA